MNDAMIDLGILQECLSRNRIAFHCDTQWKAEQLLKALSLLEYKWRSGDELSKFDMWYDKSKKTCYTEHSSFAHTISYGSTDYYINNGFEIIEFEAIASPAASENCNSNEHRDDDFLNFLEAQEI